MQVSEAAGVILISDAQKQDQDSFGLDKWGWLWADILLGPVNWHTWRAAGGLPTDPNQAAGTQGAGAGRRAGYCADCSEKGLNSHTRLAWHSPPHILFLSSPGWCRGSTFAASTAFSPHSSSFASAFSGFITLTPLFLMVQIYFYTYSRKFLSFFFFGKDLLMWFIGDCVC